MEPAANLMEILLMLVSLAITIYVVVLFSRMVESHERIAASLERYVRERSPTRLKEPEGSEQKGGTTA